MTIIIYFHQSSYRNFKDYYQKNILKHHQPDFPSLVSYNRFVELMPYTNYASNILFLLLVKVSVQVSLLLMGWEFLFVITEEQKEIKSLTI